jgi:hypothetical protein
MSSAPTVPAASRLRQGDLRPVIAIYAGLAGEPERMALLDRDFLEFVTRANQAAQRSRRAPLRVLARGRSQAGSGTRGVEHDERGSSFEGRRALLCDVRSSAQDHPAARRETATIVVRERWSRKWSRTKATASSEPNQFDGPQHGRLRGKPQPASLAFTTIESPIRDCCSMGITRFISAIRSSSKRGYKAQSLIPHGLRLTTLIELKPTL